MKDLKVPRHLGNGTMSKDSLRQINQNSFAAAAANKVGWLTSACVALCAVPPIWAFSAPRAALAGGTFVGVVLMMCTIAAVLALIVCLVDMPANVRRARAKVHLPAARSNDPDDACGALDEMIRELRSPARDPRRISRSYARAVDRLQALRPDVPLNSLIRRGYYPSRPQITENDVARIVDNDASPAHEHWNRMCKAADDLRDLLRRDTLISEDQVESALARLIPPARAVLRTYDVDTHRIEYLPGTAPSPKAGTTIDGEADDAGVGMVRATHVEERSDELSAVETRLNASATMAVSAIRTLKLSFDAAEEDLFEGDDLNTGRRLMSEHLASLVKAYLVAHDTSEGEERDQVRGEFAQGLAVIRDAMNGIMRRHAQKARRRMEDETRFLRARHQDDPLSPSE